MRTTVQIPDHILKKAKLKAVKEGITLKQLFISALEKELASGDNSPSDAPWKKLRGSGSTQNLDPQESGFNGYPTDDYLTGVQINDPGS